MNLKKILLSLIVFIIPFSINAYSSEVYVSGENIGIEVKTKGVLVIGLYRVNNELIADSSGIKKGDYIISVNNNGVNSIEEFTSEIKNDDDKKLVDIDYKRDGKIYSTSLKIVEDDSEYKTGLYVKDTVSGIGTLTLIEPESNRFLALGHAILDSTTNSLLSIDSGSIYSSYITGINKSEDGMPGEKIGESSEEKYGVVTKNSEKGIFGSYEKEFDNRNLMKVASIDEIVLGNASILTVLDGDKVEEFSINIDKIDRKDDLKNILFTITDNRLIEKTGGVVQGMSGSPILQNGKIIGAITHVIVDDCTKGYGIFIVNMLEESERE